MTLVVVASSVVALALAGAAAWPWRVPIAKVVLRVVLRLPRVEVHGLEHARAAMPRAVIAANHASFLDGLLLGAVLPGRPVFAVDTQIAKQWWARPFLAPVDALPVDPTNPLSIRTMIEAVEAGRACIISPEGRLTTTGSLMKVYEGRRSLPSAPGRPCCRCASTAWNTRTSRA